MHSTTCKSLYYCFAQPAQPQEVAPNQRLQLTGDARDGE